MKRLFLDTNVISALFQGDEDILSCLAVAERVYASVIVIGELEAGFQGGSRYSQNLAILERFLAKPTVETVKVTRETSDFFGRIKCSLKNKGSMIPLNDVWIAAQCMELGALLLTHDCHFQLVDGLRVG